MKGNHSEHNVCIFVFGFYHTFLMENLERKLSIVWECVLFSVEENLTTADLVEVVLQ